MLKAYKAALVCQLLAQSYIFALSGCSIIQSIDTSGTQKLREDGKWSLCIKGGASLAFVGEQPAGIVGIALGYVVGGLFEVDTAARYLPSKNRNQIDVSLGGNYRHQLPANIVMTVGARLGYAGQDVRIAYPRSGSESFNIWNNAAMFGLSAAGGIRLLSSAEIRAELASFAFYYNDIWVSSWEPCLGFCLSL